MLLATWHGLYIKQYTFILHVAKIVTIDFKCILWTSFSEYFMLFERQTDIGN